MSKRSITTVILTVAIALGSVNFASAAAVGRGNGGGSPPAGGPTAPDTGSDDSFKVFLGDQPDCGHLTIAAVRCAPKRVFLLADPAHCTAVEHRRIVLPNGRVVIDQRKAKIKYCDDLHTMQ